MTDIEIEKAKIVPLHHVIINKTIATMKPPNSCQQEPYKTLESNIVTQQVRNSSRPFRNIKILPPLIVKAPPKMIPILYALSRSKRSTEQYNNNATNVTNIAENITNNLAVLPTKEPNDQIPEAITVHQISGTPPTNILKKDPERNYQPFQITSTDFKNDYDNEELVDESVENEELNDDEEEEHYEEEPQEEEKENLEDYDDEKENYEESEDLEEEEKEAEEPSHDIENKNSFLPKVNLDNFKPEPIFVPEVENFTKTAEEEYVELDNENEDLKKDLGDEVEYVNLKNVTDDAPEDEVEKQDDEATIDPQQLEKFTKHFVEVDDINEDTELLPESELKSSSNANKQPYIDVTTQKSYLNHPEIKAYIKNDKSSESLEEDPENEEEAQNLEEDAENLEEEAEDLEEEPEHLEEDPAEESQTNVKEETPTTEAENTKEDTPEIVSTKLSPKEEEIYHELFSDLHQYDPVLLEQQDNPEELTDDDDEYDKFRKASKNDYFAIKSGDFLNADTPYDINLGKDFYEKLQQRIHDQEKEDEENLEEEEEGEQSKISLRESSSRKINTQIRPQIEDNLQIESDKYFINKPKKNRKSKFNKQKQEALKRLPTKLKHKKISPEDTNSKIKSSYPTELQTDETEVSDHIEKPETSTENYQGNVEDTLEKILEKKDAISRYQPLKDEEPKSYNNYWTLEYVLPH